MKKGISEKGKKRAFWRRGSLPTERILDPIKRGLRPLTTTAENCSPI